MQCLFSQHAHERDYNTESNFTQTTSLVLSPYSVNADIQDQNNHLCLSFADAAIQLNMY